MHIQIKQNSGLDEVEQLLLKIQKLASSEEHTVWLPRSIGSQFFKESRVVGLLGTAARYGTVSVRDWTTSKEWNKETAEKRFLNTIEGMASLIYGSRFGLADVPSFSFPFSTPFDSLVRKDGVLESSESEEGSSARSMTICALDETYPEPLVLRGIHTRDKFILHFVSLLKDFLATAHHQSISDRGTHFGANRNLARFVYEIFQNAYDHGRNDQEGRRLTGLRYLRLQKHFNFQYSHYLKQAKGFAELEQHIEAIATDWPNAAFFEISISDNGIGLINRFLARRTDLVAEPFAKNNVDLINTIISESLSSKVGQPGAGHGLKRAIEAVQNLGGFLSVRTNNVWLFKSFPNYGKDGELDHKLESVRCGPLPEIAGTHVNMLFPFSTE